MQPVPCKLSGLSFTMVSGLTFVNAASAAGAPCSALTIQYTNQHTILYTIQCFFFLYSFLYPFLLLQINLIY
ncbi:hypothetical protein V2W45_806712 [Cenococcum geophilum]